MQLNLSEVDESLSEKKFVSVLLKGLPREFESFCNLVKYGQDKTLDEIIRDLINFESEKRNYRNTEKKESVFSPMIEIVLIVTRGRILQNFVMHNYRNLTKRNLIQK